MLFIRSLLFFIFMLLSTLLFGLTLALIGWLIPLAWRQGVANYWGATNMWLLKVICNLSHEIEGSENLPQGPAIVMAKHQSAWETMSLRHIIRKEQAWVLKHELMWLPVFGWALATVKPIAIDRKAGRKAVKQIIEQGTEKLKQGMTVMIFPEGTRTAPGTRKKYGIGGALLAEKSGYPVIPVAHNAGVYWKRRGIIKYPGTIKMLVGQPIEVQGKTAAEITREVEDWIETRVAQLPQENGFK